MEIELARNRQIADGSSAPDGKTKSSAPLSLAAIETAVKDFVCLSDRYEKAHGQDPDRPQLRAALDGLIAAYGHDERFVARIENSGNKAKEQVPQGGVPQEQVAPEQVPQEPERTAPKYKTYVYEKLPLLSRN